MSPKDRLLAALKWVRQRVEGRALVSIMALSAAAWAFFALADEVAEKATLPLDQRLLLMLRTPGDISDPIGPKWLEEAMRDVTALGGVTVLTMVTITAVVCLLFYARKRSAVIMLATVLLAEASSDLLKLAFARARPDLVPHGSYVYSHSFPSGHSTLAATIYFTLAAVLSSIDPRRRAKVFFFTLALLITVSVGFSRVYLGVHWPTDVLGGWTLGAAWALSARAALAIWRDERPEIEPERR